MSPPDAPAVLRSDQPDLEVRRLLWQLALWPRHWRGADALAGVRRDWQLAVRAFGSRQPGDLYTAGGMCRALANASGAIVVAAGYRRAPEHPLEAAREDCLAAVTWLAGHAGDIGGDPQRLAVGGDSAGGALAAGVAHDWVRRGGPALRAQVLVYPATDLDGDLPSLRENARGYLLTRERIDWIRSLLSRVSDLGAPGVSPLDIPDLRGVAPAVVVTAGFDPLRDEGLAYVRRLHDAGVPVDLLHYPGQIHGFLSFDRVLVGGRDAVERVGRLVAAAFDGGLVGSSVEEVAIPWPRRWQAMPWLHPGQRWRETRVACMVARDQVSKLMRSLDVSGNVRTH